MESTGGLVRSPTAIGVAFGLLLGKPIGITACSWIAMRYFGASLPTAVTMRMIYAVCWVGGIGFTMSLFVAGLAFGDPLRLEAATFGIQAGSLLAGAVGYLLLQRHTLVRRPGAADTDRGDG